MSGALTLLAASIRRAVAGLVSDFIRMSSFTGSTESGNAGIGWTYTATGDTQVGVSDKSVTLVQDARIEGVITGTSFNMLGLDDSNTAQDPTTVLYGLQANGSNYYAVISGSTNNGVNRLDTLTPANSDPVSHVLVGEAVLMQVKKSGVWRTIHRFSRSRAETLYVNWRAFDAATAIGTLTRTVGAVLGTRWTSAVNLAFDGNSLLNDDGRGQLQTQILDLAPAVGTGVVTANVSIAGQTTRQMNGLDGSSATDADAMFVSGKVNILVLWEGTNSVVLAGRTPTQAATDLADYITARKAAHAWDKIVVLTTIPREGDAASQGVRDTNNANLASYNAYLIANRVALGIDAICDVRQSGSPFNLATYTPTDFTGVGAVWQESTPNRVHLNGEGQYIIAGYLSATLSGLGVA